MGDRRLLGCWVGVVRQGAWALAVARSAPFSRKGGTTPPCNPRRAIPRWTAGSPVLAGAF